MASSAASPPALPIDAGHVDERPFPTRKPSLCMKPTQNLPAASPPATAMSVPMSLTSKEWVIPPRPKPGRKPATDTPPTKRKAQNRAAQRAFRERRAARVGELEEQMKQIEDEHDQEQDTLKVTVTRLEKEVEKYRKELAQAVDRCRKLENELAALKPASTSNSTASPEDEPDSAAADLSIGCGNCTLETRCQCIDDAFEAMGGEESSIPQNHHHHHEKRPHSPAHVLPAEKRLKREPKESLEIDITSIYASKASASHRADNHSPTSAVADPCGFCSDGLPCICAEVAAEQEHQQAQSQTSTVSIISRLTPRQLNQFTPPPSEGDVSFPDPASTTAAPGCGASGPGTCAQCRADPNSTLFCKSLAASRARSTALPSGCCGGQTPGGSRCQSRTDAVPLPLASERTTRSRAAGSNQPNSYSEQFQLSTSSRVTLSCADAYTTLSRHPAYERAAGDIGEWMPKLHASEPGSAKLEGRPSLEIDAANVMAVLRDFDRRFGKSV